MFGEGRPILRLAWFEGVVVSLGAISGIVWTAESPSVPQEPTTLTLPVSASSFAWLVAFAHVAWLGWHIHTRQPKSLAFIVWVLLVACMLIWRPLFCAESTIWLSAATQMFAPILTALLLPLVAAIDTAAGWSCLPLLLWLGYRAVLILLLLAALI